TETTESSGERSLIDRRLVTIIRFARVVGHAFDTRDDWGCDRGVPSPSRPRGPYALPQGVSRIGAGAVSLCDCDTIPGFGRQIRPSSDTREGATHAPPLHAPLRRRG